MRVSLAATVAAAVVDGRVVAALVAFVVATARAT
jgi:hypothetical protein